MTTSARRRQANHDTSSRIEITPRMRSYMVDKMPHVKDLIETLGRRVPVSKIEELRELNTKLATIVKVSK